MSPPVLRRGQPLPGPQPKPEPGSVGAAGPPARERRRPGDYRRAEDDSDSDGTVDPSPAVSDLHPMIIRDRFRDTGGIICQQL